MQQALSLATLGGGCFWCFEAVFQRINGVKSVYSGYSGGIERNPTYNQVCSGKSGHAEVVQLEFDPKVVCFTDLLQVFFQTHDPTTPNRQGNDSGPQYRSIILYHSEEQLQQAKQVIEWVNNSKMYNNPVVTELKEYTHFYKAESDHQNFYNDNTNYGYCKVVIKPKLDKLYSKFSDKTNPDNASL